jgi:hypothetical protein
MVHVVFDPSSVHFDDFFLQTGGGASTSIDEMLSVAHPHYYRGIPPYQRGYGAMQRGAGIGSVFRGLWRFFLPLIRSVGLSAAQEALHTGQRVIDKVGGEGAPFRKTLVAETKRGLGNIIDSSTSTLKNQFGGGRKRRSCGATGGNWGIKGVRSDPDRISLPPITKKKRGRKIKAHTFDPYKSYPY